MTASGGQDGQKAPGDVLTNLVQQQPHHVPLPPLGGHVERGDVVLEENMVRIWSEYGQYPGGWRRV